VREKKPSLINKFFKGVIIMFDDFDTQIQCDEIKDWYDYEMYFGALMTEEEEVPEEHDDYMRSCYTRPWGGT